MKGTARALDSDPTSVSQSFKVPFVCLKAYTRSSLTAPSSSHSLSPFPPAPTLQKRKEEKKRPLFSFPGIQIIARSLRPKKQSTAYIYVLWITKLEILPIWLSLMRQYICLYKFSGKKLL